jgi:ADP-ribose pyrophosphatase YjhB (NUDIX family)
VSSGDRRRYPERPIVGVGAVVLNADGRIVLIRRRFEPLAGRWSLPGGSLELGETLEAGVAREILEETGLQVAVGPVIEVFDRIMLDETRRVQYHFVLVDYLCRPTGGVLAAGSDVDAAVLADPASLGDFDLTPKATAVIARALEIARLPESGEGGARVS